MKKGLWIVLLAGCLSPLALGALQAAPKAKITKSPTTRSGQPETKAATVGPRFNATAPVSTVRGEQVFVEYCAVCHGLHGKGDGPRSAFFSDIQYIPDLTLEGFTTGRESEVLNGIREGLARYDEPAIVMPQFKYILSDNDIRSALMYVQTLPTPPEKKR